MGSSGTSTATHTASKSETVTRRQQVAPVVYIKSFQFVHNHRHYSLSGRFVVTLAMVLDRFDGMQA